jgi:hypothetical protein
MTPIHFEEMMSTRITISIMTITIMAIGRERGFFMTYLTDDLTVSFLTVYMRLGQSNGSIFQPERVL